MRQSPWIWCSAGHAWTTAVLHHGRGRPRTCMQCENGVPPTSEPGPQVGSPPPQPRAREVKPHIVQCRMKDYNGIPRGHGYTPHDRWGHCIQCRNERRRFERETKRRPRKARRQRAANLCYLCGHHKSRPTAPCAHCGWVRRAGYDAMIVRRDNPVLVDGYGYEPPNLWAELEEWASGQGRGRTVLASQLRAELHWPGRTRQLVRDLEMLPLDELGLSLDRDIVLPLDSVASSGVECRA